MNNYTPTNAKDLVSQIEQADEQQIDEIISAVIRRYNALRTDRVASFLALPADPSARDAEMETILHFIRSSCSQQDF